VAWEDEADRALLLELRLHGCARRRRSQTELLSKLEAQGWVTPTSRAQEVSLVEARAGELDKMLDSRWPDWRSVAQALITEELVPSPQGLKELRRRQRVLPPLPRRMNVKTAASAVAEHSKAKLGGVHLEMLGESEVVRDGVVLVRPHDGMELVKGGVRRSAMELAAVQGVVALTSRALMDGLQVGGTPAAAVMTVENEAAFVDMPKPESLMLVWVPGWNTRLAIEFLGGLAPGRRLHFGDLDPNGVRIYRHLRGRLPGMEHFVPGWWRERIAEAPPIEADWPDGLVGAEDHPLVRKLAEVGQMSEQEVLLLEPRLAEDLRQISAEEEPGTRSAEGRDVHDR
jgi:hypothetical protein